MENNYNDNFEVVNEVEVPVEAPVEEPVKKSLPIKKIGILAGVAVAVIALVVILLSIFTNTYKTPLNLMMDQMNVKKASKVQDAEIAVLNGLCEKEVKALQKIFQKSEEYDKDEILENYEERIDEMKDEYGNNYKYSYTIEEKEEIDKDDLKDLKDEIKDEAKDLKRGLEEAEDYDSDDWEEIGEYLGLSKSEVKKIYSIMEDIYKEMKGVKVTKGYELTVTIKLTGSELEEPEEEEVTICVYKINGRWVTEDALWDIFDLI